MDLIKIAYAIIIIFSVSFDSIYARPFDSDCLIQKRWYSGCFGSVKNEAKLLMKQLDKDEEILLSGKFMAGMFPCVMYTSLRGLQ